MITKYAIIGLGLASVGLTGALWVSQARLDTLRVENGALRASQRAMELELAHAKEARAVEAARAAAIQVKAKEYDAIREGILRNEQNSDESLPAWATDALERLRSGDASSPPGAAGTGDPSNPG